MVYNTAEKGNKCSVTGNPLVFHSYFVKRFVVLCHTFPAEVRIEEVHAYKGIDGTLQCAACTMLLEMDTLTSRILCSKHFQVFLQKPGWQHWCMKGYLSSLPRRLHPLCNSWYSLYSKCSNRIPSNLCI